MAKLLNFLRSLINEWRELKPSKKVSVAVAVVVAIYSCYVFIAEKTKDTNAKIIVFNQKVHLGDNDLASFGGTSTPFIVQPGSEGTPHLIFYNKASKIFQSTNGFPTEIQHMATRYGRLYQHANLDAFKHIAAVTPSIIPDANYPGNSVQIDAHTKLIWRENGGSFYHENAAVGITSTINLNKFLAEAGHDDARIKSASFVFHGIHSGKRSEQSDNVELVVNGKIFPVKFHSNNVREEERIAIPLPHEILNTSAVGTNRFTLVVLPYQERYPLPPPDSEYVRKGPGHFRDIELWEGTLFLTVD